ncbi:MAG TPA: HEPN domain-containing protein [Armatimonadetes bacterium]|nr:HEPN domain-containing protein [Armatimonadota bacterium]
MTREADWMRQAEADLKAARDLFATDNYAHACFFCQQAAEKALKALLERQRLSPFGHDLESLLEEVRNFFGVSTETEQACIRLNKFYIPPRYVNAFPTGAPVNHYHDFEAQQALADAQEVLSFVRSHI